MKRLSSALAVVALLAGSRIAIAAPAAPAPSELAEWRASRAERLRSEDGWLTLVGLFWLRPGDNRFGTDPAGAIVLPAGSGPAHGGSFVLEGGRVRLLPSSGAGLVVNGGAATERALASDADGSPDEVRSGRVRLTVIRRGDRLGIRAKDPDSRARAGFRGLEWFPARPEYRVEARFVPYDPPRFVRIPTVLGTSETMTVPGVARFSLGGRKLELEPVLERPDARELFFIFRDRTSGEATYEAGRFLYADLPLDGRVTLDFNRAYNPPCAFTRFATCPLPPRRNWLPVRIEAGEKAYGEHP